MQTEYKLFWVPGWRARDTLLLGMQVTGREGMLSYEQLHEAGGLGDMQELDAMFEEPAPAPVDPEVANAIFQHLLAAGGLLGEDPGDGEGG